MKSTLMVYYTLDGNTGFVAKKLYGLIDMDVERLKVTKEPPKSGPGKILAGGRSALRKEDPGLIPLAADVGSYYDIVIAFPVWAGTWPPAVEAFLNAYPVTRKNIYIIACSGSGNAEKAIAKLSERLTGSGNIILGTLSLKSPLKNLRETEARLAEFAARRQ